jgi:pimeloyl-ACP methyl ester carboxylesterase
MDMIKEYFPIPHDNFLTKRGMAVLVLDQPGNGLSNIRGIKLNASNAEEAGKAAIDYLQEREQIDPNRIGVFGISLGAYSAPRLAARDERVRGAISFEGGVFYNRVRFVEESQPSFKHNLMYMTGLQDDEEAFQECLRQMTLAGHEADIKCPYMLMIGEWDELTPLAEADRLYEGIQGQKRLIIYEGETHVLGGVINEALALAADTLKDMLNGIPLQPAQQRLLMPRA